MAFHLSYSKKLAGQAGRDFDIIKNSLFDIKMLARCTSGPVAFAENLLSDSNFGQVEQIFGVLAATLLGLPGLAVPLALHQVQPVLLNRTKRHILRCRNILYGRHILQGE